jgi:hypothetical protein
MPLAGFEPTIPVLKQAKMFNAIDRAVTVTGKNLVRIVSVPVEIRTGNLSIAVSLYTL